MTALAPAVARSESTRSNLAVDTVLVLLGAALVSGLAQLEIKLPITPVPITGQTLGVLLVGGALGSIRGVASILVYLVAGAVGAPVFSGGDSGASFLAFSSATGGYLWGFVVAAYVVGRLAEKGWDRGVGSSMGAMLIGELIIFTAGVSWLAAAFDLSAERALEAGLYPFVVGDALKLLIAAGALPIAWRYVQGQREPDGPTP